jgi:prepilin-type N-terminal cleavage/methylation domain-containing protein
MNPKIKSFTLPELMVVMVLSGIAITMAFAVYRYVDNNFTSFSISQKGLMEHKEFSALFRSEFDKSSLAGATDNTITLLFDDKTIFYHLHDGYIVREQLLRSDTFAINASGYQLSFFNEGSEILDGIQIDAMYKGESINFLFLKNYDTYTIFQLNDEPKLWH